MRFQTLILFLALGAFACTSISKNRNNDTVHVAVASNMKNTMDSLTSFFEQKHKIKCTVHCQSSGMLTAQIEQGAPFDVFVCANTEYTQYLMERSLGDHVKTWASGKLVLAYSKEMELSDIAELFEHKSIHRIAIADDKTAPYGIAAMQFLKSQNLLTPHQSKIVKGESIAQVNHYLMSNAVDAAFTSNSFQAMYPDRFNYLSIEPSHYEQVQHTLLWLKHGKNANQKASKLFLDFLQSADCKSILSHYGYTFR